MKRRRLAGIPTEVDLASEFRYRRPILDAATLVVPVSQSGETADTLAALRLGKERGSRVLAICNVRDSTIARESNDVLYTHAGPEIGVASTKAFTTQLVAHYLLALKLGIARGRVSKEATREHHDHLIDLETGRVIEFRNEEIEKLQERVARELGFELVGHRLELHGIPLRRKKT